MHQDHGLDAMSMSIIVPSYQRRASLLRLLGSLDDAIAQTMAFLIASPTKALCDRIAREAGLFR